MVQSTSLLRAVQLVFEFVLFFGPLSELFCSAVATALHQGSFRNAAIASLLWRRALRPGCGFANSVAELSVSTELQLETCRLTRKLLICALVVNVGNRSLAADVMLELNRCIAIGASLTDLQNAFVKGLVASIAEV